MKTDPNMTTWIENQTYEKQAHRGPAFLFLRVLISAIMLPSHLTN